MVMANTRSALKYSNLVEVITFLEEKKLNEKTHFGHFTFVKVKIVNKFVKKPLSKNISIIEIITFISQYFYNFKK